jgi:hypothetical protein
VLKDGKRYCDVCASDIQRGEKYSVRTMPAEGAAVLLDADDPDLVPTWTQNPDGTVRLDVCMTCYLSMRGTGDLKTQ